MNKNIVVSLTALIVLIGGVYYFSQTSANMPEENTAGLSSAQNNPPNIEMPNLKIETLQEGEGDEAKAGDRVTVNYTGMLEDGTKFDSSIDRGQPFIFTLGQNSVIQGWELGVKGMKQGEKRKLTIPSELGYGEQGAGGIIPPNATLIFEVDMLAINEK